MSDKIITLDNLRYFKEKQDSELAKLEQELREIVQQFRDIAEYYSEQIKIEGSKYQEAIETQGAFHYDRINSTTSGIDNKLETMWRMYSVVTGTQRFISGGVISLREEPKVEKEISGGLISERDGKYKRYYDGGLISDRKSERSKHLTLEDIKRDTK